VDAIANRGPSAITISVCFRLDDFFVSMVERRSGSEGATAAEVK